MFQKMSKSAAALALVGGLLASTAQAYQAGEWLGRVGVYGVFPESNNLNLGPGATIDVDNAYSLGFNFTYMINPNIGVELLGALPFKHDISLSGAGRIGETKQLPPVVSIQYHMMPEGTVHPYVGLGLNYTNFFSEKTTGALSGNSLKLDDSWGIAGQLGIDVDIAPNWFVNADLRYISIKSDAKLNGVGIGTVDINPWVVGLTVGTRF